MDLWGPIPFFMPTDPNTGPTAGLVAVARLIEAARSVSPSARSQLMRIAEKEAEAVLEVIRKQATEK